MKKIFVAAATAAVMMSLTACGSQKSSALSETTQEAAAETEAETESETEEEDENIISFENVTLADNDVLKLELVNFYAEDVNWREGKQNEKSITIKATNKTDHEIFLNPDGFYLDGEELFVSMQDGSISPAPGKSASYSFRVARDTKPEHTALESLDELYNLEGDFSGLEEMETGNQSLEVSFSIPEALGNGQGAGESEGASESGEQSAETAETEAAAEGLWSKNFYVDDFNQPTDQWYICTEKYFPGTFSNSAVTDANLAVQVTVDFEKDISIFLYEYNRTLVKNSSSMYDDTYTITMRTADGTDHNLTGTLYCGGDRIFIDDAYVDEVLAAMEGEGNVSFLVVNDERTVESYLFTIMPSNFKEVYEAALTQ